MWTEIYYSKKRGFSNDKVKQAIEEYPIEYGFNGIDVYTYTVDKEGISFTRKED